MESYYITDLMFLASSLASKSSEALKSALNEAIAYYKYTSNDNLTGISITLPYGDSEFYSQLKDVYTKSGFDKDYIKWLKKFVTAEESEDYYDYGDFESDWHGWGKYDDDFDWDNYDYDDDYDDYDWYDEYDYESDGLFWDIFDFIFG